MSKSSQPLDLEAPLYVRWTPANYPYTVEMSLDLVPRLKAELDAAEPKGMEIGGIFTGVFPTPDSPTLRLTGLIFVQGGPGGEPNTVPEYGLDTHQIRRVAELSAQLRRSGTPAVGSFRSNRRTGPLVPSPFDTTMLAYQFPDGLYAFLLLDIQVPSFGVFYLAVDGQLPEAPSTPAFSLEEDALRSLPEAPIEPGHAGRRRSNHPLPWPAVASLALLLVLIGVWVLGSQVSQWFRPSSNQIDLNVVSTGSSLKITWDHSAPVLSKALGATIVIMDGRSHRELRLDSDDLRLGQVAYERSTKKVYVVMRLDSPGSRLPPQTFDWIGN